MRHNDKTNNNSALGLDVGTSRICLAQRAGEEFQYETQLNAFVNIPFSKMTEGVLKTGKVPHTVSGAEIVVHGNESDRFADLLNVETRRTMSRGVLNPAEPDSLSMIRKIVDSLLDPTKDRQKLQTRKLERHLDVGAIVANALAALTLHVRPLRTEYEIKVPFRARSQFRCAIAEKGIPSSPNLVRERDDERSTMLAERLQVWVVVRNTSEFNMAGTVEPAKYAPLAPLSLRPPHDLAGDQERRFSFEGPFESF